MKEAKAKNRCRPVVLEGCFDGVAVRNNLNHEGTKAQSIVCSREMQCLESSLSKQFLAPRQRVCSAGFSPLTHPACAAPMGLSHTRRNAARGSFYTSLPRSSFLRESAEFLLVFTCPERAWGLFRVRNVGQTVQSVFSAATPCPWTDRLDSLSHTLALRRWK